MGVLCCCSALAKVEERAYQLRFGDMASAEEVVRAIAGNDGQVVADKVGRKLIVLTTPEKHELIRNVLADFDRPPRNVQVQALFAGRSSTRESGAGVKDVEIETSGKSTGIKFRPEARYSRDGLVSDVGQMLLIGSGKEGVLMVGEEIPYWNWLIAYGQRYGYISADKGDIQWKRVGARLRVRPTIIGDGPMILVQITPELSDMDNPRSRVIRFVRAATEITATDGQSVRLGGFGESRDFYEKFLVGRDSSGAVQNLDITLILRIL